MKHNRTQSTVAQGQNRNEKLPHTEMKKKSEAVKNASTMCFCVVWRGRQKKQIVLTETEN